MASHNRGSLINSLCYQREAKEKKEVSTSVITKTFDLDLFFMI